MRIPDGLPRGRDYQLDAAAIRETIAYLHSIGEHEQANILRDVHFGKPIWVAPDKTR